MSVEDKDKGLDDTKRTVDLGDTLDPVGQHSPFDTNPKQALERELIKRLSAEKHRLAAELEIQFKNASIKRIKLQEQEDSPEEAAFQNSLRYAAEYLMFDTSVVQIVVMAALTTAVYSSGQMQQHIEETILALVNQGEIFPEQINQAKNQFTQHNINEILTFAMNYIEEINPHPENTPRRFSR